MDQETCSVIVYLNEKTNKLGHFELTATQLKALHISKSVYVPNRYYEVTDCSFNFAYGHLEIFVKDN